MNERIKQLRLKLALSQDEFGQAIGLSKSGISNIESGTRSVNGKHIRMLTMAYNVNPDWLCTGEGEMFLPVDNSPLRDLQKQHNLSDKVINIIEGFVQLPRNEQEQFIETLRNIIGADTIE